MTTNSSGQAQINFTVQSGSRNYPVVVEVNLGQTTDDCETHFTPST